MVQRCLRLGLLLMIGLAACALPTSPSVEGRIALLLPETRASRYESQDLPRFRERLSALGVDVDQQFIYRNAQQSHDLQRQQVIEVLEAGARVIVLSAVDSDRAGELADLALERGVPIIAYDRLIGNSRGVNFYISFDNERVGRLQGEALLAAMNGSSPTVVFVNGSTTDTNARFYKTGAYNVLENRVTIGGDYDILDWSPERAYDAMQIAITELDGNIDGVLAANDGIAGGVIAALQDAGISPLPPVTGQDAELAAIRRILAGEQYMTVYKAIRPQAEAAAELAVLLLQGREPDASLINGRVNNGLIDIQAILLTPVAVTRDNIVTTVIADGFWRVEQICTAEYAASCEAAGLR